MKHFSVKTRLTAWLTMLMVLLSVLMLILMVSISSTVSFQTATSQLSTVVKNNLSNVSMEENLLTFGDDFSFYQNGISTLIYSKGEALLAGQVPVSFTVSEAFQNGLIRTVESGSEQYLVFDLWLPMGWEDGVWIRGLMEAPDNRRLVRNLLLISLTVLPLFILLAGLGSHWIVKRAFYPLDSISATATAISEARDLSRRIGLPEGKDEFSRLAATFDQLFERLERSFEAEKQFTADASHELRTPVSIIRGACEYAQKYDETPEERQETISMIHRQAVKMSDLIAQLLSITRLDQGTELARRESVDLGNLIGSLCEEQPYDHSRLLLDLPKGITVWGDPALLSRLAQNLIDNAFKYGKPDGHVWVSVLQAEQEILLRVRDDGIGIPAEQQDKVWQRFYQADPARSDTGGAGLGLSMVQQIAQAHGGYMTLESQPGAGSAFTLHLPQQKNF